MNKKVRVVSILNLVDKKLLERLAAETSVDFNVKKLSGNIVFKLLLLSILEDTKVSLRVMEKLFVSNKFKCIAAIEATERRVAFALQTDGWYLRSRITWIKKTAMPESVKNRPTTATEEIFLLTKSVILTCSEGIGRGMMPSFCKNAYIPS